MRLLVVSNLYPPVVRGGYERECHDVVGHLAARHDVTVLTSALEAGGAPAQPGVLRALPWVGDLRPRDAVLAAPRSARAARTVRRTLADLRPDAIWLWNGAGVPASVFRTLQQSGLPLLVRVCERWFTELYVEDQLTRYLPGGRVGPGRAAGAEAAWGAATRAVNALPGLRLETQAPRPAAVCWNSEFLAGAAPAPAGVRVVHADVVLPATDRAAAFATIPRAPVPGRVLFVGRLDDRKGAAVAVRALARLRSGEVPAATLRLVGPGTAAERAALRRLAGELGVTDAVGLTGGLEGAALEREIAQAGAWCVPSVWEEPAGLVCVEAAWAGVPAVLARVGGIPELLAEGREALFHPPGDDDALARALAACLAGGPTVRARVDAARARAHELGFAAYLERMDAFLEAGLAALTKTAPGR